MSDNAKWRRSSRSFSGNCVEVATTSSHVQIRDSKNPGQILDIPVHRGKEFIKYMQHHRR
jgi:hypothetical protein